MVCDNIFVQFSGSGDGRFREFHIKDKYKTVGEALNLFKDDELLSEPGESITSFCLIWPNSQPQLLFGQVWKGLLSQTFRHIWVRAVLSSIPIYGKWKNSLSPAQHSTSPPCREFRLRSGVLEKNTKTIFA